MLYALHLFIFNNSINNNYDLLSAYSTRNYPNPFFYINSFNSYILNIQLISLLLYLFTNEAPEI